MNTNEWYYLDPDNNKKDPEIGLFCCRCKRKVKDTQAVTSFISVEVHPIHPWVRKSPFGGKHLIGQDCWDKIVKEGPVPVTK